MNSDKYFLLLWFPHLLGGMPERKRLNTRCEIKVS